MNLVATGMILFSGYRLGIAYYRKDIGEFVLFSVVLILLGIWSVTK